MTEAEWLVCSDPTPMLGFLQGRASERKLQCFSVACSRRVWFLITKLKQHPAIELIEAADRFADGLYSGPRKLDHQLNYSGGPGKGRRWQASASTTAQRSRPKSP